jgi:hypothetical protein
MYYIEIMRKIHLLLLLVYGFAFGQQNLSGTAKYHLSITGYMGRGKDGCGDIDGLRKISLKYANNPSFTAVWEGRTINSSISYTTDYFENNRITDISLLKIIRWSNWLGNCDGGPSNRENNISISPDFSYYLSDAGDGLQRLSVTSVPIIDLKNSKGANDILGTDGPLKISTIDGVATNFFQWEYHVFGDNISHTVWVPDPDCGLNEPLDSNLLLKIMPPDQCPEIPVTTYTPNWRLLPAKYQGINSLTIDKCSDVFPFEAVGKLITVRANRNGSNLIFNYNLSAPHIISENSIPISCIYTNDGKVLFTFSELKTGEEFETTLYNGKVLVPSNFKSISATQYTFTDLTPGDYKLKYNTKLMVDGVVTHSTVDSTTFKIDIPKALGWSAKPINPICYGDKGEILVEALGGTPPYYYIIGKEDTNKVMQFDENTKVQFEPLNAAVTSVTIKDLPPIARAIKVIDSKKCIEIPPPSP